MAIPTVFRYTGPYRSCQCAQHRCMCPHCTAQVLRILFAHIISAKRNTRCKQYLCNIQYVCAARNQHIMRTAQLKVAYHLYCCWTRVGPRRAGVKCIVYGPWITLFNSWNLLYHTPSASNTCQHFQECQKGKLYCKLFAIQCGAIPSIHQSPLWACTYPCEGRSTCWASSGSPCSTHRQRHPPQQNQTDPSPRAKSIAGWCPGKEELEGKKFQTTLLTYTPFLVDRRVPGGVVVGCYRLQSAWWWHRPGHQRSSSDHCGDVWC